MRRASATWQISRRFRSWTRLSTSLEARGCTLSLIATRPPRDNRTPLWYDASVPEAKWISDWLVLAYKKNLYVIGTDLHNEPHNTACWRCGDTSRDWLIAAIKAGNAIHTVAPNLLIIVEETDSAGGDATDTTWWGGQLPQAANKPVILNIPNKVVYSPHEYGDFVFQQAWFKDRTFPNNLPTGWYNFWAHLYYLDFAPLLIGEFGSPLADPLDTTWMKAVVAFIGGNDSDGMSWTYWSWNPDSGDTGGLVTYDWPPKKPPDNILKPEYVPGEEPKLQLLSILGIQL
ncbi:glycoside hydrolase superfamily [Cladochytrium replicatum]|nr:glycoside hydrolase superfamily [Cladochytrium replicatum]